MVSFTERDKKSSIRHTNVFHTHTNNLEMTKKKNTKDLSFPEDNILS